MKNIYPFLCSFTLLIASSFTLFAQTNSTNSVKPSGDWKTEPFDHRIFIENKGQFNNDIPNGNNVKYSVILGGINAYFTPTGIVYRYAEHLPVNSYYPNAAEINDGDQDLDREADETVVHYQSMNWVGCNPNVQVNASSARSDYYVYATGMKSSVNVKVFTKITYSNLYPGIDVEYTFSRQKEELGCGFEYTIIARPGADLSKVKIAYPGATSMKLDNAGNLIISTQAGSFTEFNPTGYYKDAPAAESAYKTGFTITGNQIGFVANGANASKTLVIDPWVTNPLFTLKDVAFDCAYDKNGNVYAYGGEAPWPTTGNLQLVKMNNAGTIQWTFNAVTASSDYYGDFCVDKNTGTSYISGGYSSGSVVKVNTLGALKATFPGNPSVVNELWRAEFDEVNGQVIFGAGSNASLVQVAKIDSSLTAITAYNALGATIVTHDMATCCIDPNGSCCYMEASRSLGGDPTHFNNFIVKMPLPALTPTTYSVHVAGIYFLEVSSLNYYSPSTIPNGFNGAACSPNWLYQYDGDTVIRINKGTGAVTANIVAGPGNKYVTGGLDVDACDNLYVGVGSLIKVYNSSLTLLGTIALNNSVYDLHLGASNIVYACGNGYVQQTTTPYACVLPVNLLNFSCAANNNAIELNWSTATQTNSNYFTVERAGEDNVFTPIATVKAAGNSVSTLYYEYTDEAPLQGINYYRLKETDLDGTTQTFNITSCSIADNSPLIFPNPFAQTIDIETNGMGPGIATLYNMLGQSIGSWQVEQGHNTINTSAVSAGVYILQLKTQNSVLNKKIVKVNP